MDNLDLRLDAAGIRPTPESTSSDYLKIGSQAPTFSLPNLTGDIVSLKDLLAMKKPILLVFSDPNCGPCTAMMPRLMQWEIEFKLKVMLVLINRGTDKENMDKIGEFHLGIILLEAGREVSEQYKARGTPCAVRISIDGLIDSNIACGEIAITTLVHQSISHINSVIHNKH
ncbi:MAG: redoxin domain-containing protein [Nitrosomonas sp.]|nr:redoxin domain-containing protein [Nitrosomonas sp.]